LWATTLWGVRIRAHSNAYRQIPFYFPELGVKPVMQVLCGRTKARVEQAAVQFGWAEVERKFDRLVQREDIDLIDITSPNNAHVEMAIAAAKAGKQVICEKPLATNLADAKRALQAVRKAGVLHMICHNYRRAPAVMLAKQLIDEGRIGKIYHWRGQYLQDWLMDPMTPMMWRVQKRIAGSGALGDIMAHSIDLALWLVGDIDSVASTMATFVKQRPKLEAFDTGLGGAAKKGAPMGRVDVDDAAISIARFANGALGTFEATRFGAGHKNYNWFEIGGDKGSVRFNLERMNELEFYSVEDGENAGFITISATDPSHPFMGTEAGPRYWPPGHIIGYEHTFINTVADLLDAIARRKKSVWPDFEDAVKTQAVLDAVERASASNKWEKVKKVV